MNPLPFVAYFGHHKCGTMWIAGIVADICGRAGLRMARHDHPLAFGKDIVAFHRRAPFDFWCYANADPTFIEGLPIRGFHVLRDPRDVIVSGYFSHRNSHPAEGWTALIPHRERLRDLSEAEGIFIEMDFAAHSFFRMLAWQGSPLIREIRFGRVDPESRRNIYRAPA